MCIRDSSELGGEVKVALQVGAVHNIKDGIRTLSNEVITRDDFFRVFIPCPPIPCLLYTSGIGHRPQPAQQQHSRCHNCPREQLPQQHPEHRHIPKTVGTLQRIEQQPCRHSLSNNTGCRCPPIGWNVQTVK